MLNKFFNIIKFIFRNFYWTIRYPLEKTIVFESLPDFSDNTKAVFDEMIRRGLNRKYKMVWKVTRPQNEFKTIDNVVFLNVNSEESPKEFHEYLIKSKCIICCNEFLVSRRPFQKSFYLSHGTAIKSVRGYYTVPKNIDFFIAASKNVIDVQAEEFNCVKTKLVPLGFPRNDVFSKDNSRIKAILNSSFDKVIIWYPTVRQHKAGVFSGCKNAIPIIHDEEKAQALNKVAKEKNVLIVLKPHFVQDTSYINKAELSNIKFIDDSIFAENNISSYELVGCCDALITDYSSIYFDFTLCDKPVAAIWEDLEEYRINPGLINRYEYYMRGAEKIYSLDELNSFICRVAEGVDLLRKERNEVKDEVNYSTDGKNSERVVDFIIKKAKLY